MADRTMIIGWFMLLAVAVAIVAGVTTGIVLSARSDNEVQATCIEQGGIWANGSCGWSK